MEKKQHKTFFTNIYIFFHAEWINIRIYSIKVIFSLQFKLELLKGDKSYITKYKQWPEQKH